MKVEGPGRGKRTTEEDRGAAGFGHRCTECGVVKKVVGPQAKREAVRVAESAGRLPERRVCGLIGIARGSVRYRRRQRNEEQLRTHMKELAIEVVMSLPGSRVVRLLERLKQARGMATRVVVDNGTEFLGRAVDQWA